VSAPQRAIRTNGKSDAALAMVAGLPPTGDEYTMGMLAMLPLGHKPEARKAALQSAREAIADPSLTVYAMVRQSEFAGTGYAMLDQGSPTALTAITLGFRAMQSSTIDACFCGSKAGSKYVILAW